MEITEKRILSPIVYFKLLNLRYFLKLVLMYIMFEEIGLEE